MFRSTPLCVTSPAPASAARRPGPPARGRWAARAAAAAACALLSTAAGGPVATADTPHCLPTSYDLPGAHSQFLGCRTTSDVLLHNERVFKPRRLLTVREKFIDYPGPQSSASPGKSCTITAIHGYDRQGYGKGGYAQVVDGGIGNTSVRIRLFTDERNKPLRFGVEIYGACTR
ncbi:MBF2 family protein [Streptomyces sp. NPDC049813]|uniref:MBF2 family protein n=1 Tax=Streptomyces sp. NPDC049813 TaxID=3365597 RepID=UPI0037889F16